MSETNKPADKPLGTQALRQQVEQALAIGEMAEASALANQLAQRKVLGPWEQAVIGRAALAVEEYSEAAARLSTAIETLHEEGAILVDLAASKAGLERWDQAASLLGKAIAQRPNIPSLHERHAIYLANSGDLGASIEALDRALALEPNRASAWSLLGERQLERDDAAAAEKAFKQALACKADESTALWNLALLKEKAGDLSSALDLLDQVPEETAETAQARHRRGQMLLSLGRLEEGWQDYAARLKNLNYVSWQYALRVPYWSGEDLTGKHLVIWADQGLGEQLLTASLLEETASRCGKLTFACDPRLLNLLIRSMPSIHFVPITDIKDRGPTLGPIDAQATLSELGAVLRPNQSAFPNPTAFLNPDMEQVSAFRERLKTDGQKLIGLSWRSANALASKEKSTRLKDHWIAVLQMPGVRFVSLQYGDVADDVAEAVAATGAEITTVTDLDPTQDVDGFASLVAAMDAVISTSNTTVHVAGGLGIPTWAILPHAYGRPWYWFDRGETSPWYQNLSLIRSQREWGEALNNAAAALQGALQDSDSL